MATLELGLIDTWLVATIVLTKLVVFAVVVIVCRITGSTDESKPEAESVDDGLALTTPRTQDAVRVDAEGSSSRLTEVGMPCGGTPWMCRAGLYAIFATQSNDFALGLPLINAIWGESLTSVIYLVAPFQLALLNPLGFALMEWGCGDAADAGSRPRRSLRVLRRVLRSPLVLSVLLGLVVRALLLLGGPDTELPAAVQGIFVPLRDAFTATALVTLGLSLEPELRVLARRPTAAACLLFGKVLLTPLLMRIVGDLLRLSLAESRDFAFLYGMLPAAPTVIVFAREFGQPADVLAALQFLCLLLAVPFLFVSTAAIELPSMAAGRHDGLLDLVSAWLATLGAVVGAVVLALLLGARAGVPATLHGWLCCVCAAALLFDLAALVHALAGGCASATATAVVRPIASWALYTMRGQAAAFSVLLAHQACPIRSARASPPRLRRLLLQFSVAAAVLPLIIEAVELHGTRGRTPPSLPISGIPFCGGGSVMLQVAHGCYNAVCALVIGSALLLTRLAPLRHPGAWYTQTTTRLLPREDAAPPRLEACADASGSSSSGGGVPSLPGSSQPLPLPLSALALSSGLQPLRAPGGVMPLAAPPDAPSCEQPHLCVQLWRWRTRLSLLLLYLLLTMVGATALLLSSLAHDMAGVQLEVMLLQRVLLFSQGPFLGVLLAFSPEVTAPVGRAVRRALARLEALQPAGSTPRRAPFLRSSLSGVW